MYKMLIGRVNIILTYYIKISVLHKIFNSIFYSKNWGNWKMKCTDIYLMNSYMQLHLFLGICIYII